ncbi:MAG TPA: hypothetical protein VLH09_12555 [Bryobacteraceae bacterium]|nr:hypothetical protein [Bryobacteraceae bacterium]
MLIAKRLTGRWWAAAVLLAAAAGLDAQPLQVRAEPGRIRVSPSKPQFLEGRVLERLHNGATVVFALQLALLTGSRGATLARVSGRFALSYDIWEEKYAVTRLADSRKSISHVSAAEAEAWCLDSLILTDAGLSPDSAFWIRLEVLWEQPEEVPAPGEEAGVTLARLVDLFSRSQGSGETSRRAEAGPFRLRDLR